MPSQQLQTIIQMLRSRPIPQDASVQETREAFEKMAALFPVAADIRREAVDAAGVPAEWAAAPGTDQDTVIFWLHGGGYALGSINTHRDLIARISRACGGRALALDYRLAPEHPYPAAVEDASAAYRWLLAQGLNPARIVIGGDSAGGGLALAATVILRDAGQPLPAAAVCISPWVDLTLTGESLTTKAEVDPMVLPDGLRRLAKAYLGDVDPRDPLASPLYADLRGLPPLLIQVGTSETLLDDALRLGERARAAGVDVTLEPWEEMIHVWHFFAAMLPAGQQAIERIGEFIRGRVPAAVPGTKSAAS